MPNKFTIKYLFEIYPNIDFTEEFVISQTIENVKTERNSQATERAWSHIFDSVHNKRHIQTTEKDKYEVKFILSRSIDIDRMVIAYTSLTTTEGETFIIYDVELTEERTNGLEYFYTLTFYKNSDKIINHLSSDNVLSYKSATGTPAVNELVYTVNNPSYVFNNINIYFSAAGYPGYRTLFKVPLTDLTDTITAGDDYYLHTDNVAFNAAVDNAGDYFNFATCESKDADYVYFRCSKDEPTTILTPYTINNLVINHEASYPDIPSGVTVADKEIDLTIYTFINPIISNIRTQVEGISPTDGIDENQYINSKYKASFKVWVTTEELYLIEYLDYALNNNIILNLADGTSIKPVQVKDISKPVEKDELINLHEFDIDILYKNHTINIFR